MLDNLDCGESCSGDVAIAIVGISNQIVVMQVLFTNFNVCIQIAFRRIVVMPIILGAIHEGKLVTQLTILSRCGCGSLAFLA